jgi:beta-galactosidase
MNVKYPHEKTPPKIQDHYNPVGSYKRTFEIPSNWKGKEVILHFGAASSMLNVWVNGEFVGYSEDSKTPAEFNITKYLKSGKTHWQWKFSAGATVLTSKTRTFGA